MTCNIDGIRSGGGHRPGLQHFSIDHEGGTVSVSRGGRGRTVVLCPGLYSTQAGLHVLIELLRRDHDVVAFDLRGHGLSTPAARYSFADFLGDLAAVVAAVRLSDPAPVLAGYSLGADLAAHYASVHPGGVGGLVLVDGANPIPEPFLSAADMPEFRAMWENSAAPDRDDTRDAADRVSLTAQQILDLNQELDMIRTRTLLGRYRDIDAPISMIMSASMAGGGAGERTRWRNRNWREGIERLSRARPDITTHWLDADHGLAFTHAPEIARIVADHIGRLPGPGH
ncbi:alpha/beta fold hydrolase [Nocardia sp. NPDC058499]|uniref:alpha/beta fold hydrolase n=1 Tax=Nocardia sp. NPDC058499 TaxID=3346530 RepID=UPI00365B276F